MVTLTECRKHAVQYIGETENALQVQLLGHRSDINHRRIDRPGAKHFTLPDHSDFHNNVPVMLIGKADAK